MLEDERLGQSGQLREAVAVGHGVAVPEICSGPTHGAVTILGDEPVVLDVIYVQAVGVDVEYDVVRAVSRLGLVGARVP